MGKSGIGMFSYETSHELKVSEFFIKLALGTTNQGSKTESGNISWEKVSEKLNTHITREFMFVYQLLGDQFGCSFQQCVR